ncbi:calmodulin-binding receptor-like cytoplasmic kinase 3 isoform X2 [Vicia villosa]|uniref:calmodulin-binding receptor-like cytoplasmic kinase 3 isoform X2 n=1 Tax=Vicia villosa TaxID=3911 RepID=UPI00273CC6F6|nr:calmodulin-binding receptor-like cytoplasmic kinase 3 isoform X2 [Vicia villosa]
MDYTVLYLVILLQLLQFSTIFGSEVVLQTKDCGYNRVVANSYSSHGEELFYINGNVVNKDGFCKALKLYSANGCDVNEYFESNHCVLDLDLDVSFVNLPSKGGRKLLQKDLNDNSTTQGDSKPVSSYQVGIFAGGALLACCAIVCPCFYAKRRKATAHTVLEKDSNSMDLASSFEPSVSDKIPSSPLRVPQSPSRFSMSPKLSRLQSLHLNLSQVSKATRNFSETLQIGEGGFGTVYRANLDDGLVVAVKRAKREHFESLRTEFSSEVELLAKIDHRNLVKLLGYIDKGNERILITEFVPNGTLREHLDGLFGKILDFNQRLEIAIDVAHGLTYLHLYAEKQIIHRDVKSSNILLTERMRAKVADFGFAKLGPVSNDHTHISTKVKGTVGYLDPEYMKTYHLTPKSDVYSFGILLLEILTGRRPVEMKKTPEERVTLRWAFRKYNEGNMVELLDPLMQEAVKTDIVMKMLDLAFSCAAPVRSDRPDMKAVCEQLWAIRADYLKSSSETARRE